MLVKSGIGWLGKDCCLESSLGGCGTGFLFIYAKQAAMLSLLKLVVLISKLFKMRSIILVEDHPALEDLFQFDGVIVVSEQNHFDDLLVDALNESFKVTIVYYTEMMAWLSEFKRTNMYRLPLIAYMDLISINGKDFDIEQILKCIGNKNF